MQLRQKPLSTEELEVRRQETIAQAVEAAPCILKAVIDLALRGDLEAAKLVLKVAGLDLSAVRREPQNANFIQVNITPQEQALLERDFAQDFKFEGEE